MHKSYAASSNDSRIPKLRRPIIPSEIKMPISTLVTGGARSDLRAC
jgi:hypothetical protein